MKRQMLNRVSAAVAAGIVMAGVLGGLMAQKLNALDPLLNAQRPEESPQMAQPPNPPVDYKLVDANTKFGFKLFSEVLKQDSGKNVFVSPTSIAIALSMAYNGANGTTQQAMRQALELQGLNLQDVNHANNVLKSSLENADPDVQLSIANSLWANQNTNFKPQFLQRNQQYYGAKVTKLDFGNPDSIDSINDWVKENTHGKIEQIISEINSDDILFLINAIYFKGKWTEQFDKSKTVERPFYLLDGAQKQHPMMSQSGNYRYYENENFQAISLPYGTGRLSLYVFLPRKNSSLETFQQQLNAENWQRWINEFRMRDGSIQLPRFKFEYDIVVNDALKALGMEEAFDESKANFSNMASAKIYISEVKHKTFVEVNEEGTEAAAATAVRATQTSARMPEEPFQMIVDRPFFCAIRDNQTGTILFMGSIVEPK